jgi:hypothetical protein
MTLGENTSLDCDLAAPFQQMFGKIGENHVQRRTDSRDGTKRDQTIPGSHVQQGVSRLELCKVEDAFAIPLDGGHHSGLIRRIGTMPPGEKPSRPYIAILHSFRSTLVTASNCQAILAAPTDRRGWSSVLKKGIAEREGLPPGFIFFSGARTRALYHCRTGAQ